MTGRSRVLKEVPRSLTDDGLLGSLTLVFGPDGPEMRFGMTTSTRILFLEDNPADVEVVERACREAGWNCVVRRVETEPGLTEALSEFQPHAILCDFALPALGGLAGVELVRALAPEVPIIVYTGTLDEETAVKCLTAGADDYILKDRPARLLPAIETALSARRERQARRQAQKALEESERRFRALVETAHDAILSFDEEGLIQSWNPATEFIFGYRGQELAGRPLSSLLEDGDEGSLRTILSLAETAVAGSRRAGLGGSWSFEGRRQSGSLFPLEVSFSEWESGGGRRFTAIIRDTTERVVAREALENLSHRYELLLNSAGEGIMGLEPDGSVSFVNPMALSLLGWTAGEILGGNFHDLLQAGTAGSFSRNASPILATLRGDRPFHGESTFLCRDGSVMEVALSCTPIRKENRVLGAVLVFEDATRRKMQDRALRASEARYRGLVEHATYGIYRSTPEGRFTEVNPALVEMLGYESREALLKVDLYRDIYRDPGERFALVEKFRDRSRFLESEAHWLRRDGTPITVRLSGRVIRSAEGKLEGFEVVVEDLTERKGLEEQLRQAQKMEAVGQLTGGIAHDFNNVLSVILLNADILRIALEEGEMPEVGDLDCIINAARKAAAITRKLLTFSRQAELSPTVTGLDGVLDGLEPMLRTLLPESVALRLAPNLSGTPVRVDPGSVEQILMNLVANSRDAIPDGGTVRISLEEATLDEEYCGRHSYVKPGRYVCLEVSDTGTGMDEETQKRVFDPFFTTKAPSSGTGLGMAMVYGLTKQQGGHVHLYSQVGKGTSVRLYFPVQASGEPEAAVEIGAPGVSPAAGTVLLVEDEENLRLTTTKALQRAGYQVLAAEDGHEALEFYEANAERIDLILSDLILPKMNGSQLYRKLVDRHGPVRFVLTSGYSVGHLEEMDPIVESLPFVRKPWTLEDLLSAVQRAIHSMPPS